MAAYVVEHDLSYRPMEHIPFLIKATCSDYEHSKNIQCHQTKCSAIIKKHQSRLVTEDLKTKKFSIIVDETTDKGCVKHLGVIARYFKEDKIVVVEKCIRQNLT